MLEQITLRESLLAMLVERDGVDAGNVVTLMRQAEANVEAWLSIRPLTGAIVGLDTLLDFDEADDYLIMASHNGRFDIFTATEDEAF